MWAWLSLPWAPNLHSLGLEEHIWELFFNSESLTPCQVRFVCKSLGTYFFFFQRLYNYSTHIKTTLLGDICPWALDEEQVRISSLTGNFYLSHLPRTWTSLCRDVCSPETSSSSGHCYSLIGPASCVCTIEYLTKETHAASRQVSVLRSKVSVL